MADTRPTLKRKRSPSLEIGCTRPAKRAIRQHESLWFEDGNLVVLSQDVSFRLHKTILSLHSEVFRDMFLLPVSADTEVIDGCPVVRLTDRAEHLALFFHALYGAGKKSWHNPAITVPFTELRAILTLSMKYDVQHLCDEALHRLRRCFPAELVAWDQWFHMRNPNPPVQIARRDAIAVVNLARRFDLPSLLPPALYAICQLPKASILDAVQYAEDDCEQLSSSDIRLCLKGLDILQQEHHHVQAVLTDPLTGPKCRFPDTCRALLVQLPAKFMSCRLLGDCDPLRDYDPWIAQIFYSMPGNLCSWCEILLQERLRRSRQAVWRALPRIFDITPQDTISQSS